jgi:AcrR family transcriptional regulator
MPVEKLTPERRRQLTRDTLLDAAEEIFVKRGVSGASMEQIAAEAGFSRGAIYSHFGSKEDLLLAVMDRFITRQLEQFRHIVRRDDPMEAVMDAAETFRKTFSTEMVPLELELRMSALRHPDLRRRLVEADRRFSEENARLVENLQGEGTSLRIPARDLADIGRAAVIGLLLYASVDEQLRDRYEALVETLFVLMTEALMLEAESEPQSNPQANPQANPPSKPLSEPAEGT